MCAETIELFDDENRMKAIIIVYPSIVILTLIITMIGTGISTYATCSSVR